VSNWEAVLTNLFSEFPVVADAAAWGTNKPLGLVPRI
jgi:hypothetical protein